MHLLRLCILRLSNSLQHENSTSIVIAIIYIRVAKQESREENMFMILEKEKIALALLKGLFKH